MDNSFYMEFFEVVKKRHSVRSYKKKKLEEEKLRKILEAANSAPSAGNLQAYEISCWVGAFDEEELKKRLLLSIAAALAYKNK